MPNGPPAHTMGHTRFDGVIISLLDDRLGTTVKRTKSVNDVDNAFFENEYALAA